MSVASVLHYFAEKPVEVFFHPEQNNNLNEGYYMLTNVSIIASDNTTRTYRVKMEYGYSNITMIVVVNHMESRVLYIYNEDTRLPCSFEIM